jgi:hypothetical protein
MATGILNNTGTNPAALANTTNTTIYEVPADTFVVATVNMCNRNASQTASVRLAISATETPADAEWIEFGAQLLPGGTLERGGLVIDAGKFLVAYADGGSVSVTAYGIETATA